ncbi:hypothetical protein ACWCQL_39195 [Streptomyces sp. NPDC002073]
MLADAVRTVEVAWPAELAALLPTHHPALLRKTILEALDEGRTGPQLAERVRRRWWTHGYARALAEGELASPVGVAVALVRPSVDCPDPMCEDGTTLHLGEPCPKCEQRRTDRRVERRTGCGTDHGAARLPGPRGKTPAPRWWECAGQGCTASGKGLQPTDGLCWQCHDHTAHTAVQQLSARLTAGTEAAGEAARMRETISWTRLVDDAYAEHAQRRRTAQEQAQAHRQAVAEAAHVRALREQLLREHPELASYAQEQA